MNKVTIGAILVSALATGCATPPPTIDTSPTAEVTFDGLHEVQNSRADKAWAAPGLDLSGYTKIMLMNAGIEYRPGGNAGRTYSARSRGGPYEITERQKERFEQLVTEEFREELARSQRFEIVEEPGPDVLLIRGGLLDVVSYVPPDDLAGRVEVYLSQVGAATLVVELRDSITGAIMARAVDGRAAEPISGGLPSNRVTNTAEIRRLVQYWATRLREGMEGFTGTGTGG